MNAILNRSRWILSGRRSMNDYMLERFEEEKLKCSLLRRTCMIIDSSDLHLVMAELLQSFKLDEAACTFSSSPAVVKPNTEKSPQERSCSAQKNNCCDKYHIPRLSDLVRSCLKKEKKAWAACNFQHLTTLPSSAKPACAAMGRRVIVAFMDL